MMTNLNRTGRIVVAATAAIGATVLILGRREHTSPPAGAHIDPESHASDEDRALAGRYRRLVWGAALTPGLVFLVVALPLAFAVADTRSRTHGHNRDDLWAFKHVLDLHLDGHTDAIGLLGAICGFAATIIIAAGLEATARRDAASGVTQAIAFGTACVSSAACWLVLLALPHHTAYLPEHAFALAGAIILGAMVSAIAPSHGSTRVALAQARVALDSITRCTPERLRDHQPEGTPKMWAVITTAPWRSAAFVLVVVTTLPYVTGRAVLSDPTALSFAIAAASLSTLWMGALGASATRPFREESRRTRAARRVTLVVFGLYLGVVALSTTAGSYPLIASSLVMIGAPIAWQQLANFDRARLLRTRRLQMDLHESVALNTQRRMELEAQ